ncbi:uncharacterized protein LOC112576965 [Pomacea canaliculata]|uniref:uncharacterized protein LOC112576965 n=1 Tax=Pomacea canaliculata TaxID=400727 RepID=UPI000D73DF4B|nr:uncharacterized protein LOC112576965 [Pomacea canaliculata]
MGRCSSVPTAYVVAMVMLMASFALALAGVASPLWWESWPTPRVRLRWGLWQCAPSDAKTKCDSFTGGNGDSVVVMLGCVGSVLQVSVCVWTLLTCLRRPRRSREIVTVVGAISGGAFGLSCVILFVVVHGMRSYSWGLALDIGVVS